MSADRSTVFLDVTTSWRARGGQGSGTLRVERSYAAALAPLLGERLRFCRYHETRRRFLPLPAIPAPQRAASRAAGVGIERKPSLARRAERAFRTWRRGLMAGLFDRVGHAGPLLPGAAAGDVLLMVGENWAHHDFGVIAALRRQQGVRVAALCQDLIPEVHPEFFAGGDFLAQYRAYVEFLVHDADLVIAISESTKTDILAFASRHGGIAGRVAVVQLGADFNAAREEQRPAALANVAPGGFVISVSTIQSRKNFDLLYRLWRAFSIERQAGLPKLVIVGREGYGGGDLLRQIAHDPAVRDTVLVLHDVSDAELAWLYRHCLFTLYPSFYEGWGLPVSESLAFGKYCVASNTSSLPEAGQRLALHLDPRDDAAWRAAVRGLIAAPDRLKAHESRIASEFHLLSWAESAGRLVAELERLAGASLPSRRGEAAP